MNINKSIFIAASLGIILGLIINLLPNLFFVEYLLVITDLVGQLFIKSLKMILVPLVFFSIVVGVSNLGKGKNSSLIWKSTLLYFVTTMSIAITLALVVMNIIQPGIGINIESWQLSDSLPSETMTIPEFLKQFLLLQEKFYHSLFFQLLLALL